MEGKKSGGSSALSVDGPNSQYELFNYIVLTFQILLGTGVCKSYHALSRVHLDKSGHVYAHFFPSGMDGA